MSYNEPKDLIFNSAAEVKAFTKWYLGTTVNDSADAEFTSEQEREDFLYRRASRLEVQVDNLRDLKIDKACATNYNDQTMFKLCRKSQDPLSSAGSDRKSSRFNYKETELFKNRVVYFGQDKDCCYSELFHNDFMTLAYPEFESIRADELPRPKYTLHEFKITTADLLVVTSSSTFKALGLNQGALKDEWFDLNLNFNIPASSQIFSAIARSHGFKGILYSSVRHQTKNNLVLFENNLTGLQNVCKKINEVEFDIEAYEASIGIRKK